MGMPTLNRIYSGDIVNVPFKAVDAATGEAIDLTGATELVVKVFAVSEAGIPTGAAVISENLAGDVDIDDAEAGEASVDLVAADTASLSGRHWFEAKLTDAGGMVRTLQPAWLHIVGDLLTS